MGGGWGSPGRAEGATCSLTNGPVCPQEVLRADHRQASFVKASAFPPPEPQASEGTDGSLSRGVPPAQVVSMSVAALRSAATCVQMDTLTLAAATRVLCCLCRAGLGWTAARGGGRHLVREVVAGRRLGGRRS